MSNLKQTLAMLVGSAALLALLGAAADAQTARKKKPVARNPASTSQGQWNAVRPSYQSPGGYYRAAPGTGILHGGPSAGWGGPP